MTAQYMIKSFRKDKVVKDNIIESWLCVDCGVNTNPGCPDGPSTRIDLALYGKVEASYGRRTEVYDVKNTVWKKAGMRSWNGCLCVGCLESRIGRRLRPQDFSRHDAEVWERIASTRRLRERRGLKGDGPEERTFTLTGDDVYDWSDVA